MSARSIGAVDATRQELTHWGWSIRGIRNLGGSQARAGVNVWYDQKEIVLSRNDGSPSYGLGPSALLSTSCTPPIRPFSSPGCR